MFYVVVRLAYSLYYVEFDLTPEEVGLGYQETIAASALALLSLFLFQALLLVALCIPFSFVLIAQVVLLVRSAGSSVASARRAEETRTSRYTAAVEAERRTGLMKYLYKLKAGIYRLSLALTRVRLRFDLGKIIRGVTKLTLGAAFLLTVIALPLTAHLRAKDALTGKRIAIPKAFQFLPYLHVRAEPATVVAVGTLELGAVETASCVLFLAQSEGTTFLYIPGTHEKRGTTLRLPSGQISLSTGGSAAECDA